jgi:hypothetical protein
VTITFNQTARDVVTGALRDLGVVAVGRDPKAAEMTYGIDQLNLLLAELAAEGASPWAQEDGVAEFWIDGTILMPAPDGGLNPVEVAVQVPVGEVVLDPRPRAVSNARLSLASSHMRPLHRLSAGEFDLYPNPQQRGVPVAYEVREKAEGVSLRVWPFPDKPLMIYYSYTRALEDVEETTPLDLPQVWGSAIREMLKARLTAFGPVDPAIEARAEFMKRKLLDHARPESYHINGWC